MSALYPGMTTRLAPLCGMALALTACVGDPELSETSQAASCTKLICGSNSPIIGGLPFYQLDQTGTTPAPESGLRIVSFKNGWLPLQLKVQGARLQGRFANFIVLQGNQLVGATLVVEDEEGNEYEINFEARDQTQRYWEDGDDGTLLESWLLTSNPVLYPTRKLRICPIATQSSDPLFSAPAYHALIFRGDRYDAVSGEVIATGEDAGPWFNVACAGDVLSKLLIIRHAEAAQDAGHQTSLGQRTAAMKMFSADYCGTGPNTELGIQLDWANVGGWNYLDKMPSIANIEAIWNAGGAVCVNNPRLIPYEDMPCVLPKCETMKSWQDVGDLITILPWIPD